MDAIKRVLGLLWIALALAAAYFCIFIFGIPKFTSGKQDDLVFGIVILFVLTPIIVGGLRRAQKVPWCQSATSSKISM